MCAGGHVSTTAELIGVNRLVGANQTSVFFAHISAAKEPVREYHRIIRRW